MSDRMRVPAIYNVTLTNANTEYSQALPATVRAFALQPRTAVDVRLAYVTGKVATPTAPFWTMTAGGGFGVDDVNVNAALGEGPITLYLASASAGTVVEIQAWSF